MAEYGSLPFAEQIEFFRDKVDLPTRTWRDIWEGQHSRAFVVAGAMREELLSDLRRAVDRAVADGGTLEQFRKDFDDLVARRGWTGWTGEGSEAGRAWRTRVIYETNLRTSYHAGRYRQMKEIAERRPYWRYRHNDSVEHPREQHLAWDGRVLRHDDPWWDTHYPPNGWGCRCYVETLAERDMQRIDKEGPDEAPTDPGDTEGIDEGWGYNVGEAAWGRQVGRRRIAEADSEAWEAINGDGPKVYGRPGRLPADTPVAHPAGATASEAGLRELMRDVLDGEDQATLADPSGARVTVSQAVADSAIAAGGAAGRERYWPLIPELIREPYEVWATFYRNAESGRIALRRHYLKRLQTDNGPVTLAGEVIGGHWSALRVADEATLDSQRQGLLVWGREE